MVTLAGKNWSPLRNNILTLGAWLLQSFGVLSVILSFRSFVFDNERSQTFDEYF